MALGLGRPRATKDLDVYVEPTRANAKRLKAALGDFFGGSPPGYTDSDLLDPDAVIQLGVAPVRIDILSALEGFRASRRRGAGGWRDGSGRSVHTTLRLRTSSPRRRQPGDRRTGPIWSLYGELSDGWARADRGWFLNEPIANGCSSPPTSAPPRLSVCITGMNTM